MSVFPALIWFRAGGMFCTLPYSPTGSREVIIPTHSSAEPAFEAGHRLRTGSLGIWTSSYPEVYTAVI